jgi:hypothetical protein
MRKKLLYTAIVTGAVLSSSCERLVSVQCKPSGTTSWAALIAGFDSGEISRIEVIRYARGEMLKTPIDTLNYTVAANATRRGDTLYPRMALEQGHDYRVRVTPAFREWRVTDIEFEEWSVLQRSYQKESFDCLLDSYIVDSQRVQRDFFLLVR